MKRASLVAGVLVASGAVYFGLLRRPVLTFGATPAEADSDLPGDDLIAADGVATRAISIDAAPADIWPWVAQIGPAPRGGIYTFDWIENILGLNMHSSDVVLDEYQHPEPGLTITFGANTMVAKEVVPESHLVWQSTDGNWVWSFVIRPSADRRSRLISRNSYRLPRLADRLGMLPMEPASLIMERRMLLGFKERAERLARER